MDDATIGANAPADFYYNHPLTGEVLSPDEIACVHTQSVWNNVIIDLEPNPLILPSTPQPSSFVGEHILVQISLLEFHFVIITHASGSCVAAGFTECCFFDCLGFPSDCNCDDFCREVGDCCYDIDETCPTETNTTGIATHYYETYSHPPIIVSRLEFNILVANGFYIHQIHFEGNSSDIILTNTSGTAVGIDFNYE